MKKIMKFFLGVILFMSMFGIVFLTAAIYDTTQKITVDTFFFQPEDEYVKRIEEPIKISDIDTLMLRDMLLEKFLTEYFYVIPNEQNVDTRKNPSTSPLYPMSARNVFYAWQNNVLPEISDLSAQGALRTVKLISAQKTPTNTKTKPYWRVEYELKTWEKPNDFMTQPVLTRGVLFMQISFNPNMMETVRGKPVEKYLESGNNPAAAFRFGIMDIATEI